MDDRPFFQRPQVKLFFGTVGIVILYIILVSRSGGWETNLLLIARDATAAILIFVLWLVFLSQFILPVRTMKDRRSIYSRLVLYVFQFLSFGRLKLHGPAVFIQDGNPIEKATGRDIEKESKKKGAGVVWLDTASGAVLRNPVKFTRTIGPGVAFTKSGESLAGAVDLHIQSQSLGPDDDENPFIPKADNITEDMHQGMQARNRWATSGLTRDGIEVVVGIGVTFKINADEKAHEGGTYFGYNEQAVFRAIANEGINENDPKYSVPWNELPAPIAIDVWREYLSKFTLSQLFTNLNLPAGQAPVTGLQFITNKVKERLIKPRAPGLDDSGNPTGEDIFSQEYKILTDRGIRVIGFSVKRLFLSPSVEDQLVRQFSAGWLEIARREREQVEQKRSFASLEGAEDALRDFAAQVGQDIGKYPKASRAEALELLLQNTRKSIIRNPTLLRRMSNLPDEIDTMLLWLKEQS